MKGDIADLKVELAATRLRVTGLEETLKTARGYIARDTDWPAADKLLLKIDAILGTSPVIGESR